MFSFKWSFFLRPYLLLSQGFVAAYTGLYFLLFIRTRNLSSATFLTDFILPLLLASGLIYLLMLRQVRLLCANKNSRLNFLYFLLLAASMVAHTVFILKFLEREYSPLVTLDNLYQLNEQPKGRYYTFSQYYVDKAGAFHSYSSRRAGGRYNHDIVLTESIYVPLFTRPADANGTAPAWLLVEYTSTIDPPANDARKEQEWTTFKRINALKFGPLKLEGFTYLVNISGSLSMNGREQTVFQPQYTPWETRNDGALSNILLAYVLPAILWLGIVLVTDLTSLERNHVSADDWDFIRRNVPGKDSKWPRNI